jgi:pentatricopeptide repeat protein
MNAGALFRYNFRVLVTNNWWLLVFPVAISQFALFWNVTTQKFTPALPANSVEVITPLLAAFLSAHVLSAEYASRIGAILASKPVNLGRVVVMRLAAVFAFVGALTLLSLTAYYLWMEPYPIGQTLAALVPSTLFLSMLALTFATLLRSPLAGFAVAGLFWAMDLPFGAPMHPFLTLRGLANHLSTSELIANPLTRSWWVSKALLLVLALLLYVIHSRLVFALGAPFTAKRRRGALVWAGSILALTLISGAAVKVVYGYQNRGALRPNDAAWFRAQFSTYGPLPVDYVFGKAFHRYLGRGSTPWRFEPGNEGDTLGDNPQHRRDLSEVLTRMKGSIWAPSAAELSARLHVPTEATLEGKIAHHRKIVEEYPNSPYVYSSLGEVARAYAEAGKEQEARATYEEMLKRGARPPYDLAAYRFLTESHRRSNEPDIALEWARKWAPAAPVEEKFTASRHLMELLQGKGDTARAQTAARDVIAGVRAFRAALRANQLKGTPGQTNRWEVESNDSERKAEALLKAAG